MLLIRIFTVFSNHIRSPRYEIRRRQSFFEKQCVKLVRAGRKLALAALRRRRDPRRRFCDDLYFPRAACGGENFSPPSVRGEQIRIRRFRRNILLRHAEKRKDRGADYARIRLFFRCGKRKKFLCASALPRSRSQPVSEPAAAFRDIFEIGAAHSEEHPQYLAEL